MLGPLNAVSPPYLHDAPGTKFPVIVDDAYETSPFGLSFTEGGDKDGNLLTGGGLARFYAADSYTSPPHAPEIDSDSSDDGMYLAQQQPGLAQSQMQQFDLPYSSPPDDVAYATPSLFPHERPNEDAAYHGTQERNLMPEVSKWEPSAGVQGTSMGIVVLSTYELDPTWHFEAYFGDRVTSATVTVSEAKDVYVESVLSLEVPLPPDAAWSNPKVALQLEATDATGASMGVVAVGHFTYVGLGQASAQSSPQISRKRQLSADTDDSFMPPQKRINTQALRAVSESAYEPQPFGYMTQNPSLIGLESGTSEATYAKMASLDSHETSPKRAASAMPATSAPPAVTSQPTRPPSQTPSTWTVPTPTSTQSPQLAPPASRKPTGLSPIMVHPKLCRTTTLQQSPTPAAGSVSPLGTPAPTPVGNFNPYAMLPLNKAVLKINGDLEEMTRDWTEAETTAQRRLVHFWRNQTGSTINTSFKPVATEERQPSFIVISCIWWEAKQEHFVTSVDTIFLLENLVGGRFTVEEKNRIRRNLEGFRPLTVSKGKSDSEDFFKLIMGFPNPKPRNIEKDVKVFPWKILAHALKKIMGKYSASYSSMASALPQAIPTPSFAPDLMSAGLAGLPPRPGADVGPICGYDPVQLAALGQPEHPPMTYAPAPAAMVAATVAQPPPHPHAVAYPMYGYGPMPMSAPPHHPHHPHNGPPPPPPQHAITHPQPHPASAPHHYHRPASASWDFSGAPFMESPVSVATPMDPSSAPPHPHPHPHAQVPGGYY